MSAIKSIRRRNIQSHQDVLIELPETGVVVFTGDNSNGKSVMRKVLSDVISGRIKQLRNRKSLVRRAPGVHEGYLEITKYDGSKLTVCINLASSLVISSLFFLFNSCNSSGTLPESVLANSHAICTANAYSYNIICPLTSFTACSIKLSHRPFVFQYND